jgi:hypothetical protein
MEKLNTAPIFESFDTFCEMLNILKETGNLDLIEKDIALEKLREMYVSIHNLPIQKKQQNKWPEEEKANTQPPVTEEKKPMDVGGPAAEKPVEAEIQVEEEFGYVLEKETAHTEDENKVAQPLQEKKANPQQQAIIGERYSGQKSFMDERISKQHPAEDVGHRIQLRPIEDIGKAIGLNDKFLYVNELFKGDALLYKNTIQALNAASDFDEASSIISTQFVWDMESESAQKFLEVVRRKFITIKK